MDRFPGRAVRLPGLGGGRRAHGPTGQRRDGLVLPHANDGAVVRAVASAAALALLALTALSSLGSAQVATRSGTDSRAPAQIALRMAVDTLGGRRRDPRPGTKDSTRVDASAIAAAVSSAADSIARSAPPIPVYRSRADSMMSERTRVAADRDQGLRIVVSLNDRRLWAIIGSDTLLKAPVAVSTDETLEYAGKSWTFETPRGVRTVIDKSDNPVWIPPE